MLCCLLASLLAFAGVKGRRQPAAMSGRSGDRIPPRRVARLVGFGWCCGVLAFEFMAAVAAGTGGLTTTRPELLLLASSAVTAAGLLLARGGGTPHCRRGWALFAMSASAGAALTELADLHLLALHRGPDFLASIALHGLAVVPGIIAGRLLMQLGRQAPPIPARRSGPVLGTRPAAPTSTR
jgi:hypothetical protein